MGLLDVDICGPSVPRMLGLTGQEVHQSASGWSPVWVNDGLGVMSIGFMLPQQDNAVIWRGPRKNGLIKQFLTVRGVQGVQLVVSTQARARVSRRSGDRPGDKHGPFAVRRARPPGFPSRSRRLPKSLPVGAIDTAPPKCVFKHSLIY